MTYLEWNNLIGNHFFNSENSGQVVYLYITKQDIIEIGKQGNSKLNNELVWRDFIDCIRVGIPGCVHTNIVDKALFSFYQFINDTKRVQDTLPSYLGYLSFFVLVLTEGDLNIRSHNYYERLNNFLLKHNFNHTINSLKEIDSIWTDLEDWSIMRTNGDLGYFELKKFKSNRKYVEKPFSQCLLSPRSIKRLAGAFLSLGLVPYTKYPDAIFKKIISDKSNVLGVGQTVVKLVKDENNELGQSIIDIIRREYDKWTGESQDIVIVNSIERTKRNFTIAPLFTQFELDDNNGRISFSYRIRSTNDYPADLRFLDMENLYHKEGWSISMNLQFKESLELKDVENKWLAKLPERDVRIFINGFYFQLDSNLWIETDTIYRTEWMYLLVKSERLDSILVWKKSFNDDNFVEESWDGIPKNYCLFRFKNPTESHPSIPTLKFDTTKGIKMHKGLRITFRHFLNRYLPEVEVVNADGSEIVSLLYKNHSNGILLENSRAIKNRWLLPDNVISDTDFQINIEGIELERNTSFQIKTPNESLLSSSLAPKRNKFQSEPINGEPFFQGNLISNVDLSNAYVDGLEFVSNSESAIVQNVISNVYESKLISWLNAVKVCNLQEFYETFETVSSYENPNERNILFLRRATVYLLDYLGYVDLEYSNNRIVALPAKIILLPATAGRYRALLIGCRDSVFTNRFVDLAAADSKLSIELHDNESKYLLPPTLTVSSANEKSISELASKLCIEYDKHYLLKLKALIPTIDEYKSHILQNNEADSREGYDWPRKVFDIKSLKFIQSENIDRKFALVEYSFNSYNIEYGIWIDNKYYVLDKNWGKYWAVLHYSDTEIGFDRSRSVARPYLFYSNESTLAIPASLPLPKIVSRLLIQLSGKAPVFKQLNLNSTSRWYNVYSDVSSRLISNFFRFNLNIKIENSSTPL